MPHPKDSALALTVEIVSAIAGHQEIHGASLPDLIRDVYQALASVSPVSRTPRPALMADAPAARPKAMLNGTAADHLVCLDCGLHMKMLKRHLQTVHEVTPAQYRAKWNLPADYPMVSLDYAALRSSLAKESGLGKRLTPRAR